MFRHSIPEGPEALSNHQSSLVLSRCTSGVGKFFGFEGQVLISIGLAVQI